MSKNIAITIKMNITFCKNLNFKSKNNKKQNYYYNEQLHLKPKQTTDNFTDNLITLL